MTKQTHEVVREARGRQTVVDAGPLPKMRDRLRQLRQSTRAGVSGRGRRYPVTYTLREVPAVTEPALASRARVLRSTR